MVLVAVAMLGDYDLRFQSAIARDLPSFLVNPTGHPSGPARRRRRSPTSAAARRAASTAARRPRGRDEPQRAPPHHGLLPVLGNAPEFTGTERWFNTAGNRPLSLRAFAAASCSSTSGPTLHQLPPHAALPRGMGRSAIAPTG